MCHIAILVDILISVKTTLNLPDELLSAAKQRAAAEHRSLTSLFEEALRMRLDATRADAHAPVQLPTWNGDSATGYRVDITDKNALLDALDDPS